MHIAQQPSITTLAKTQKPSMTGCVIWRGPRATGRDHALTGYGALSSRDIAASQDIREY